MGAPKRCQHVREDATRCKVAFGIQEDGLCWFHSPRRARERTVARRKGQRVSAERQRAGRVRTVEPNETPGALETAEDAQRWSAWAVRAKATGVIDAATARETQYGVRTFLTALDKASLEQRIRELKK